MGTRSLTTVISTYKNDEKIVKTKFIKMYRQLDGYPSGMGMDLADFLKGTKVVNGLGGDEVKSKLVFNGAGCLAAQLVAHFKDGAGSIYIEPITAKDCGQAYEYEIIINEDTKQLTFKCIEIGYYINDKYFNKKRVLFEGNPGHFEKFIQVKELI